MLLVLNVIGFASTPLDNRSCNHARIDVCEIKATDHTKKMFKM